jgi:NAD(P)-dependent dehydrogenase (short-subunit alcohol dehydrogenase family)
MAAVYDTNVLSTQRVNRAVLPHMRERRRGLLIWVGSSSTSGGTPPYLGPYFAAKAAEDSVAVSYAAELARFGIETSIIVPGAFTSGTHHFANAGHAGDEATAQAYEQLYAGLSETVAQKLAEQTPRDADPEEVARQIAHVVEMSHGTRPFRVHIDPLDDGATEVNAVRDRVRERFLRRVGIADLLVPADGDGR